MNEPGNPPPNTPMTTSDSLMEICNALRILCFLHYITYQSNDCGSCLLKLITTRTCVPYEEWITATTCWSVEFLKCLHTEEEDDDDDDEEEQFLKPVLRQAWTWSIGTFIFSAVPSHLFTVSVQSVYSLYTESRFKPACFCSTSSLCQICLTEQSSWNWAAETEQLNWAAENEQLELSSWNWAAKTEQLELSSRNWWALQASTSLTIVFKLCITML